MAKKKDEDVLLEKMSRLEVSHCEYVRLGKDRKKVLVAAIISYFEEHYESMPNMLDAWKSLCRDFGVKEGSCIFTCKKAMKGIFVNIFDFIEDKFDDVPLRRYATANALRDYSIWTRRIFPLRRAKKDTVLRALLIEMFKYDKRTKAGGVPAMD